MWRAIACSPRAPGTCSASSFLSLLVITLTCVIVHNINNLNAKRLAAKHKIEAGGGGGEDESSKMKQSHSGNHMPMPTYVDPSFLNEKKKSLKENDEVFKIEYRGLSRSLSKDSNRGVQRANPTLTDELNEKIARKPNSKRKDSIEKYATTYKSFYDSPEEPPLLSNANESSRRASTPTYSSSAGSLSSPLDISDSKSNVISHIVNENPILQNKQSDLSNKKPPELNQSVKKKINSQISHLLLEEDPSTSLRRNSYTKAIFFDNGH